MPRQSATPNRPGPRHEDPDRPMPSPEPPRGKGDEPHYTTWLVVRYQPGDVGNRPFAPGTVFWESPDVWTQGSQGVNQPVVNEPTQVFARVTNLGLQDATGVTIKYWWADPSVAIVEDPTKLIGQITNALIPSNNSLVFQCPNDWVPIEVNNGHECLVVEAFIPVFDGLTDPMHPAGDRHVGQKNEQLVMLEQGEAFQFHLRAHNFTAADQQVAIEARPGLIPRNFTHRFGSPETRKGELLDPTRALLLEIQVDPTPARETVVSENATKRLAAGRRGDITCLAPPQVSAMQHFRPGEVCGVTITGALPPSAQHGEVYVTRIIERIGDVVVGGYTLYITLGDGKRR